MMQKIHSLLFENTSTKQTILKNTFWLTAGNTASRILRAVLILYAARILGTEGYGIFSYVLSVAAFFTVLSDIGLSSLLTRESVRQPEKVKSYLSTTLAMKLGLIALTVLITVIGAPYFVKIDAALPLIPFIAVLLALDSLRGFAFSIARAENRMQFEAGLMMLTDICITGIGLAILFLDPSAEGLTIAYTAGSAIGTIAAFTMLRRELGGLVSSFDRTLIKPIFSAAWPFAVMSILGGFMINIDTIIIGIFRSASELGLYAAAMRPIQILYLIPGLVATSIFPIISRHAHRGEMKESKTILENTLVATLALGIPVTIGGIVVGTPLIVLLFGEAYLGSVLAFQLLMVTVPMIFIGSIVGNTIFAHDRQRVFIVSTGAGAMANVVLDFVLIPIYGIAGSAVATIIAQFFTNGLNWGFLQKIYHLAILRRLWRIVAASAVMGAAAWIMNAAGIHVLATVAVAGVIYAALLVVLREPLLDFLRPKLNAVAEEVREG